MRKALHIVIGIALIAAIGIGVSQPHPPSDKLSAKHMAVKILSALKNRDLSTVAIHAHPDKGVRFTPYTYASDQDRVFKREELELFMADDMSYRWGTYDGSGEPIDLIPTSYLNEFVWNTDYTQADEILWNEPKARGSSLNNAHEFYPDAQIVEYYVAGKNPDYGGLDWSSLRLVFEAYEERWYLVGIIHDQWTT